MLNLNDLKTALADKAKLAADLASAQEQIANLTASLANAETLASEARTLADSLTAQITEANTLIEGLRTQVTTLEADKATVAEKVSASTVEQIAQLGIASAELPPSSGMVADAGRTISRADFDKLNHTERNEFFRHGGKISE